MKRREFITLLGGAAAAWPNTGSAQLAAKRPVIAVLNATSPQSLSAYMDAFLQGMKAAGYTEGRDFDIVYAATKLGAAADLARLPELADALVALRPTIILAPVTAAAIAAKKATSTIPIVSPQMIDPVGLGLVKSHAQPGGNVTGLLASLESLPGKQIEMLREIAPDANKIGILVNVDNAQNAVQMRDALSAVTSTPVQLVPLEVRSAADIKLVFDTFKRDQLNGLLVSADPLFFVERRRIAAFAANALLPAIYSVREHVEDGGLLSYGINRKSSYQRAAYFVDRILKGKKASDLPIELPTRLELVINLKAAKALGLTIQEAFLLRADEVIE
jgi:putative ABC transport system substrate-binding protein